MPSHHLTYRRGQLPDFPGKVEEIVFKGRVKINEMDY
jgi:hypothetical protein